MNTCLWVLGANTASSPYVLCIAWPHAVTTSNSPHDLANLNLLYFPRLAYFLIFPSSHLTILFHKKLVAINFRNDKRLGLVETSQRGSKEIRQ